MEQVDAFQIRNEKLKVDYQKSRNDVDRLICQREKAIDEKRKAEDTEKDLTEAFKDLTGQVLQLIYTKLILILLNIT